MGRLNKHSCYVAGAIDRCPEAGKGWRDAISPRLEKLGIQVLNPLKKIINIGLEDDDARSTRRLLKENGDWDSFSKLMRTIRHADLRMVDKSDFLIVYLDLDIFACGTIEEMTICNKTKKPILVFCKQGKRSVPDWIWGMIPHQMIFENMEELLDYIEHIDQSDEIEDMGRWVFFDYNRLV